MAKYELVLMKVYSMFIRCLFVGNITFGSATPVPRTVPNMWHLVQKPKEPILLYIQRNLEIVMVAYKRQRCQAFKAFIGLVVSSAFFRLESGTVV